MFQKRIPRSPIDLRHCSTVFKLQRWLGGKKTNCHFKKVWTLPWVMLSTVNIWMGKLRYSVTVAVSRYV